MYPQTTCYNGAYAPYIGAGCTAYCNLLEFSGLSPMCNGTFNGCSGCPATGPAVSQLFTIPAGCTATLTASFQRRCNGMGCTACFSNCSAMNTSNGCCNSGIDANDYLSVGGTNAPVFTNTVDLSPSYTIICGSGAASTAFSTSGNTITATGSNNGGAIIQYAQTGGVLFLEGRANRQDEIITFTLDIQSGCDCVNILPVDIFAFDAKPKNGVIELKWYTKNEQHLSHYKIEKSTDGINFYNIANIPSENSYTEKIYTATDDNPTVGITYYKLTPVNKSGIDERYIIRDVLYQLAYQPFSYSLQDGELVMQFEAFDVPTNFSLKDMNGKILCQIPEIKEHQYKLNIQSWSKGVYVGILQHRYQTYVYKIIIL